MRWNMVAQCRLQNQLNQLYYLINKSRSWIEILHGISRNYKMRCDRTLYQGNDLRLLTSDYSVKLTQIINFVCHTLFTLY
jgi:hypothetical protein